MELATTAVDFGEDDVVPVLLPLTARLERTFAARASELPAATETLLLAAALNDSDALPEMLAAASIVAEAAIDLTDLEPALSAGLVEVEEWTVRFRHPLMRSAIFQAAAPAQRQAVHAALAAVLDDQAEIAALSNSYESLTPREQDVLRLVVAGMLNKQIGLKLGISEITVKAHRGKMMQKMKADSVADLVKTAVRLGLAPAKNPWHTTEL